MVPVTQETYKQTLLEESSYFMEELLSHTRADVRGSFLLHHLGVDSADNRCIEKQAFEREIRSLKLKV